MSEFDNKTTEQLSDLYGEWLVANGFEGDEPAYDLLMYGKGLPQWQKAWLTLFIEAYKFQERREEAGLAAEK